MKENYQNYICSLVKLFLYEEVGKDHSDEADMLREQMIELWYGLTLEERKQMNEIAEEFKESPVENKLQQLIKKLKESQSWCPMCGGEKAHGSDSEQPCVLKDLWFDNEGNNLDTTSSI